MAPRSTSSSAGGGIDLLTLAITAIASGAAAYLVSKIWPPGALASAAVTPVLVALFREGLMRPAKVVTQAVPVRGLVRSAPGPAGTQVHESSPPESAPAPPAPPELERVPQQGEVTYHSAGRARRWRLAIVTGLLGFLVAAVVFTVPELVSGRAASGGGATTLFGGHSGASTQPTPTTTVPGRTVTVPPPAQNAAPPPPQVVTVAPAPAVTVTTPAPSSTTTPQPAPAAPAPAEPPPSTP
jgi:hypothetical protein